MRAEPTAKSRAIRAIPFGHNVIYRKSSPNQDLLLGVKGYWYEVQNDNVNSEQVGWIFAPLLRQAGTEPVIVIRNGAATEDDTKIEEVFFDRKTGVFWTSCNQGQKFLNGRCDGISLSEQRSTEGLDYCKSLNIGNLSWKLATIEELKTISNSTFNTHFPYSEFGYYVSSTDEFSKNSQEEYTLNLEIPGKVARSRGLEGRGIVKCSARK